MVVMGNLGVRLQSLQKTLQYDSEKMAVTNIGEDEKIKTVKLSPFASDIVTLGVERQSKKWVEWNALEMSTEWIKHEYQNGWSL